jgi:hypothetical protein
MDMKRWTTGNSNSDDLEYFAWGCMNSKECQTGKPEGNHQLIVAIDKIDTVITNRLGCMQWQYSVAFLAAYIHGIYWWAFQMCCNNLEA